MAATNSPRNAERDRDIKGKHQNPNHSSPPVAPGTTALDFVGHHPKTSLEDIPPLDSEEKKGVEALGEAQVEAEEAWMAQELQMCQKAAMRCQESSVSRHIDSEKG